MRARALTLLHAAMSEVWEGKAVPADGGVRARNQQKSYVERVAGRSPMPEAVPRPRTTWPVSGRGTAAQTA
jgi:RNA polymerase sigma factor for flagellar operon FliA